MSGVIPVSFEFFPPKTQVGQERLLSVARALSAYHPEYFSVTFGAGGSTQRQTPATVLQLKRAFPNVNVAPHLSCVGQTQGDLDTLLTEYLNAGITSLVVLRGDLPSGSGALGGDFQYAKDLVAFIRQRFGKRFTIKVGCYPECHPEAPDLQADFNAFCQKVKAGADQAITQYFYCPTAYGRFVERCQRASLDIDIIPGIMPIVQFDRLTVFSERCHAEIPRWLRKEMASCSHDVKRQQQIGIEVVTHLCDRLLQEGAPGLHFYTLNQQSMTQSVLNRLQGLGYAFGQRQTAAMRR